MTTEHNQEFQIKNLYQGRLGRKHYILGLLTLAVIFLVPVFMILALEKSDSVSPLTVLALLALLSIVNISFAVSFFVRRFHDLGYSGWYCLTVFIPFVGIVPGLFLLFAPGKEEENQYGKRLALDTEIVDVICPKGARIENMPSDHVVIAPEVAENTPTVQKSVLGSNQPSAINFTSRHKIILAGVLTFVVVCSSIVYIYVTKERLHWDIVSMRDVNAIRTVEPTHNKESEQTTETLYEQYLASQKITPLISTSLNLTTPRPAVDSYMVGLQQPVAQPPASFFEIRARLGFDPQGFSEQDVKYIQDTGLEPLKPNQSNLAQKKVQFPKSNIVEQLVVGDLFKSKTVEMNERFDALNYRGNEERAYEVAKNWVEGDKKMANEAERAVLEFHDKSATALDVIDVVALVLFIFIVVKIRKQEEDNHDLNLRLDTRK